MLKVVEVKHFCTFPTLSQFWLSISFLLILLGPTTFVRSQAFVNAKRSDVAWGQSNPIFLSTVVSSFCVFSNYTKRPIPCDMRKFVNFQRAKKPWTCKILLRWIVDAEMMELNIWKAKRSWKETDRRQEGHSKKKEKERGVITLTPVLLPFCSLNE